MDSFRYQAIKSNGTAVNGVIQAEDRRAALLLLGERGLFPSSLESEAAATKNGETKEVVAETPRSGRGVKRKEITAFTREIGALLGSAIPIPQALDGLGEEEQNPALKAVILEIADAVRKGSSFSGALDAHPRLFNRLYVSMVRVGEEAGALPKVVEDLATLLEREDDVRSEVKAAVAYPLFVLGFGVVTVVIVLTFVLPRLATMLQQMLPVLPLPTLILIKTSLLFQRYWLLLAIAIAAVVGFCNWWFGTRAGEEFVDRIKLKLPILGSVFTTAALSRFARTLGILVKSGVSLLPALKIVENTIGNVVLGRMISQVAEETRGGDSLAGPLRKLGVFPKTVVQMINVGEESGKLDEMLLKVAEIEERHMRARTKTLISLLAPMLILAVGAMVGFMVIAVLLPIFKLSRSVH